MQPNRNPTDWQQPTEQPTQAPYAAPVEESQPPLPASPVVTTTPDEPPLPVVTTDVEQSILAGEEDSSLPLEDATPAPVEQEPVHWQATEYIQHEKSPIWFVAFTLVVVVLIAAAIFLMQSISFAILVPVMAAAILVYTHRPPRLLDYTLSRQGLHINDRLYPFTDFKGFGVIHDGFEYSVMLLPVQRFKPGVSVYFPEEAGEAIVDMLGARLPMQELHLDVVDKIIRKLRI